MTRPKRKCRGVRGARPAPKYPYVRCGRPGHADEPGYAVCEHVSEAGAVVAFYTSPTPESLGMIQCARPGHGVADMWAACASCVREKGWDHLRDDRPREAP